MVVSKPLTDCNQLMLSDNMSTTSSDVGQTEIHFLEPDRKVSSALSSGKEESTVVIELNDEVSSSRTDTGAVNSCNDTSSTVNHIPKNSYQQLFADESTFGANPQTHIERAGCSSVEVNGKDDISSSAFCSTCTIKPEVNTQDSLKCETVQNVMPLKELASVVLSQKVDSKKSVIDNTPSPSSKNTTVSSPPTNINKSLSTTDINPPVMKTEPQTRDFPHLPLVGNLFTANFVDDVISGAMEEVKQRQHSSNAQDIETGEPSEFSKVVEEITRSVDTLTDNLHRQSDVSFSDASSLGLEDLTVDESVCSDQGETHTLSDVSHPPSNLEHDQAIPQLSGDAFNVNTQQDNSGLAEVPVENHWSQCNGYLEDEEETYTTPGTGERELVTEIVFISETSFMDEETQQHYDPEETTPGFGGNLNPDAPEFVPSTGIQTAIEPSDVSNTPEVSEESKPTINAKSESNTNRYSDIEDHVDVSDSSDDIAASKLYQSSLTSDVTDTTSFNDATRNMPLERNTLQETGKIDESFLVSPHSSVNELVAEMDKNLNNKVILQSLKDEESPTILFGGDLFEDIELDNIDNKMSVLDEVFVSENSQTQETSPFEKAKTPTSSVDICFNDDANFSDEEYVGEKYMDHQQIYDPLKYKDYYQICSALDVPDSPLDLLNQDKMLNATKSAAASISPKASSELVLPDNQSKNKPKVEESEVIPSGIKARAAEIVLHETDDASDCGSEDVETIGHRYETPDEPNHTFVNQLSLAAEMLRTKQELPYDDQFKPVMDAGGSVPTIATLNHGTVLGTPSRTNRHHVQHHYYGNPCFEMDDVAATQAARSKEVSDSGVQSEESTDESEDFRRQWNDQQTDDNSPHKASFAYKKLGTKSKPVSAMLKGKSDPLCLCCEIM